MIFVLPIWGEQENSLVSLKFARSHYFALISQEAEFDIIHNPYYTENEGVGFKIYQLLMDKYSVESLIGIEFGLKIQQLAKANKTQLILLKSSQTTLKEVLDLIKNRRNEK